MKIYRKYCIFIISLFIVCPITIYSQYNLSNSILCNGIGFQSHHDFSIRSAAGQAITGKTENEEYNCNTGFVYYDIYVTGIEDLMQLIPKKFELYQNYPNPFNPSTTIKYALPKASTVKITLYNILGQRIAVLLNQKKGAGYYTMQFNASGLASGMYFYHMQAGNFNKVKRMIVIK